MGEEAVKMLPDLCQHIWNKVCNQEIRKKNYIPMPKNVGEEYTVTQEFTKKNKPSYVRRNVKWGIIKKIQRHESASNTMYINWNEEKSRRIYCVYKNGKWNIWVRV